MVKKRKKLLVKPDFNAGDSMISSHPHLKQSIPQKFLRKLRNVYLHHRTIMIVLTVLFLGGGGYVVYAVLAAEETVSYPTHFAATNYQFGRGVKEMSWDFTPLFDTDQYGVYMANTGYFSNTHCKDPGGVDTICSVYAGLQTSPGSSIYPGQKRVVFSIWGAKSWIVIPNNYANFFSHEGSGVQTAIAYNWKPNHSYRIRIFPNITVGGTRTYDATITDNSNNETSLIGKIGVPDDYQTISQTSAFLEMYAGPKNLTCSNLPYFGVNLTNMRGDDGQVAVFRTGRNYGFNAVCRTYILNTSLNYIDTQMLVDSKINNGGNINILDPVRTDTKNAPVTPPTPPPPPAKNPRRGEDDGRWSVWPVNNNYYTNPALPGRCVFKASNGTFAVGVAGADYDCSQLTQMYKCQNEFAKLNPSKPETFAKAVISPECGNQANIRGAGQFVLAYNLSQTVPKGNLEGRNSDCTIQTGWAYSDANKNVPINVHLYYDGPAGVGTGYQVPTNVQRDDLRGFGNNGIHGFEFKIPDKYKDRQIHTVYMYAIGIQTNGWANNKNPLVGQTSFICDYPPQGNVEVVNAKMENGTFQCKVQGWAFDRTDPNANIPVHAYIDGYPGANQSAGAVISTADIYRLDLQNAGQGNGKHGFYFDIPQQFRDANKHKLRVYALGVYGFNVPDGTHPLIGEIDFQCDDYVPAGNLEQVIIRTQGASKECIITGWAADLSASIYSNPVTLYFDLSPDSKTYNFRVDNYLATLDRPDVRAAGYGWGKSGNHGFEYKLPSDVYHDGKQHTVYAYSMNIDWYGSYIKQNNTFIGKKTFTCPK